MIDEPAKSDPRKYAPHAPHTGVDDPGQKPPASDPENRKGPLKDPPTKDPTVTDPPVEPHVPGDPQPEVNDPPSSHLQDGVAIPDPNFV